MGNELQSSERTRRVKKASEASFEYKEKRAQKLDFARQMV